jgi:uncharacterized membrane protein
MGRHKRFTIAFALGSIAGVAGMFLPLAMEYRALIGVNAFFIAYLALMARFARTNGPDDLRRHAEQADEGVALILLVTGASVAVSLGAIAMALNGPVGVYPVARWLALASVALGWAMVHTLLAFHYAHLFYRPDGESGLSFPGSDQPGSWDFLYMSFVVGMTAQVSDVVTTSTPMRRMVLAHSVASFFYNTVILALAVNAAVTAALQ